MPTKEELELDKLRLENETTQETLEKARSDRRIAEEKAADDREAARLAREKSQADAEVARVTAQQAVETTKIAQDKSELDNETTRLSNEQKLREGKQADYESLAAKIAAAVPKLSQIPVNTVTVPEGYAFRESENVGHVLDAAVAGLVSDLAASTRVDVAVFPNLVITSDPNLAQSAVAYYAMKAEFTTLSGESESLHAAAFQVIGEEAPGEPTPLTTPGVGDILAAGAAAAATVVTEVAGLFATESSLTNVVSEPPAFTVHARITRGLLESVPGLVVSTDRGTPVAETAPLLQLLQGLLTAYDRLADAAVALRAKINMSTGDNNAPLRAQLESMNARVSALRTRIETLIARVTTVPTGGGAPPLTEAIILATSAIAAPETSVLVVAPAKAYTDQVVVKRRLVSPRISVSTYIELPYVLMQDGQIVWSGCPTARTGSTTLFERRKVRVAELGGFAFQATTPAPVTPANLTES